MSAKTLHNKGNAGFTLVELMVSVTVFSIGIVVLSGSMLSVENHQSNSDYEATGKNFNQNVLELMQAQSFDGLDDVLTYDPGITDQEGMVTIAGYGTAPFAMYAVIPSQTGGEPTYFELGQGDPGAVQNAPNPIEVMAQMSTPDGSVQSYSYQSSTMINY